MCVCVCVCVCVYVHLAISLREQDAIQGQFLNGFSRVFFLLNQLPYQD